MIVGEEQWIGQYHDEEYDLFFKKIRKNINRTIKKVNPLQVFNPLGRGIGLIKKLREKPPQQLPSQSTILVKRKLNNTSKAKKVALEKSKQDLLKERAEFEEKIVQEKTQIEEEKVKTEQEKIDVEQGENRRMLYIGLAGLGVLVIVGGIIVFIKSRPNQLNTSTLKQ